VLVYLDVRADEDYVNIDEIDKLNYAAMRDSRHSPVTTTPSEMSSRDGDYVTPHDPSPPSSSRSFYSSLNEVPRDVSCLAVEQVLQCLRWLNLDRYVETFRAEQIDGEMLTAVDQKMLTEDLGFTGFHAMKLEKFTRDGWRPKTFQASSTQHHHQLLQQEHAYLQLTDINSDRCPFSIV